MAVKTIGILTSGGDAPGMNAAIRAVVRTAKVDGIEVYGIKRGYNGLINDDMEKMDNSSVMNIIHRGGTILYTARCDEFKNLETRIKSKEVCEKRGIEALIVIGGDGSFNGALKFSELGIPCIGIPGTIDNDIQSTEYTIGFDTASNTAMQMIDKIRDTTQSHDRCTIVEVMGRNAGYIALETGIACGAVSIMIPEDRNVDVESSLINRIIEQKKDGKTHFIVVVAEGYGKLQALSELIELKAKCDVRISILGHVQRGGSPTVTDRVMASKMGYRAVELIKANCMNRIVGVKDGKIIDVNIVEALNMDKIFDTNVYKMASIISQ